MIFSTDFRTLLAFLTLLVLPMNMRIIMKSTWVAQEMKDSVHPTTRNSTESPATTIQSGEEDESNISSERKLPESDSENSPRLVEQEDREPIVRSPFSASDNVTHIASPRYKPVGKNDPNSFAACLQIMDDNHFLIEWLAYHYHVMPLRRLIVLVDPHSKTTPAPILDRWRDRIDITLWDEKVIFPNGVPPPPDKKKKPTRLGQHRTRQRQLTRRCVQKFHEEGRQWVVSTDTDEYTMINNKEPQGNHFFVGESSEIPSQREPGSVLKLLQNPKNITIPHTGQHLYDNPCITMSRKVRLSFHQQSHYFLSRLLLQSCYHWFLAAEIFFFNCFQTFGTKSKGTPKEVPGFHSADFQTLNWRYYADEGLPGKVLMNLKLVRFKDIPHYPSIHRPLANDLCQGKLWLKEGKSPFVANHYPGNLKQMMFRTHDARGNYTNATAYWVERFESHKKKAKHLEPETIQQWLPGFVESVGEAEANRLLEYVGQPELAATGAEISSSERELETPPLSMAGSGGTKKQDGTSDKSEFLSKRNRWLEDPTLFSTNSTVPIDDPNSFAACLYASDDIDSWVEWIAYHYHVMPLRRLVLFSQMQPSPVLESIVQRWEDRMKISVWGVNNLGLPEPPSSTRHRMFVRECLRALHGEQREWVLLTSANEYTMINDRVRYSTESASPLITSWENPNLPYQGEPGSVLKFLRRGDVTIRVTGQHLTDNPCITMARKEFVNKISPLSGSGPAGLNPTGFSTFKWKTFTANSKAGKSMVNLSLINLSDIGQNPRVNRPLSALCKGPLQMKEYESVFVINQYPGNTSVAQSEIHDDNFLFDEGTVEDWLFGFIGSVGLEAASRLLMSANDAKGVEAVQ